MEPVVLSLASNEHYFAGLYCAVASAVTHLDPTREVDLKVIDGGITERSRDVLSHLVRRSGRHARLEFVPIDESVFRGTTLGPGRSHMAYCRILLPDLLDVRRLIYLDCDVLVFRDLSPLFDRELSGRKIVAAVPDSETLVLGDDSRPLARAMNLPPQGRYFNSGVMLMNLEALREEDFSAKALEFFKDWKGHYRFWDQSAFNFLLHGRIEELPEYWNRASWRFDQQQTNELDCVLHYTTSAPWLGGAAGPAQALFEQFAADAGLPVNRQSAAFKKSRREQLLRSALAPFRALAFPLVSLLYKLTRQKEKYAAYQKAAHYWRGYILSASRRRRLHHRRIERIQNMKFIVDAGESAKTESANIIAGRALQPTRLPPQGVCSMRVLQLNTHCSGGSYEYAALLSTALAEQGIDSRVLCKNSPSAELRRPFLDRVIRAAYVSFSTEPWHGTWRLLSPPAPEQLKDIDVVHLHTVADWFDVPRWLETLPRRIGVVVSLHDMWHFTGGCFLYRGCDRYSDTCTPCPILKPPLNWVLAKDEQSRKLHAYRDRRIRFVANSQWLADLADNSPIVSACGGMRVIPPGIDTAVFKTQDKKLCRKQLDLPADAFVIVTGGASLNDSNKNVPWLLEQLARLPDIEGVIVLAFGEGAVPVPAGLNVRVTGGIHDRRDLARLLAAADVFVSPSLMETYGLTLVEAMACGTPVVAFRVGGIPEAAPHGQGAILCEPGDGAALIETIEKLRNSAELRADVGKRGRETVHVRNNLSSFGRSFAEVYRKSVSDREDAPRQQAVVLR
jgi:lipopolysaccharide biosynthesis glycosyltransferase/glycosyltransferase involved in cell wall biosynthesis